MLRVGILAAGGGTNLQAIIDAVESKKITDVELCFVLSNKPGYGLWNVPGHTESNRL